MLVPSHVAVHLVLGVEPVAFHEAGRQAQRHGRVVGPLTRLEAERTAADHVGDRRE